LGAVLVVSFLNTALIPPFQSPDEFDHIKRAYLLTRGQIVLETVEGHSSGGFVDTGLLTYMSTYEQLPFKPQLQLSKEMVLDTKYVPWSGEKEFSAAPGTGYYFPLIYAPQAIGLAVGELSGLSV